MLNGFRLQSFLRCGVYSVILVVTALLSGCQSGLWNQPYSTQQIESPTLFSSFSSPPKHLDPVVSYSSNEASILGQIYEPPLQYHYLKRPYELEPLTLTTMPKIRYLDAGGNPVTDESAAVYSEYHLTLKPGIRFQPHPAFVTTTSGEQKYANLSDAQLEKIHEISDFNETATRELEASDYVYAIKRMALRQNHSPILDTMNHYIVGLKDFSDTVSSACQSEMDGTTSFKQHFFDLNRFQIKGVQVVDKYNFTIRINGRYPQFKYWLAMNFFAPIAWEVDRFYKQPGLVEKNLTLDTSPVGTGPYMLAENNPNKRMRLLANPNFHKEYYPESGLAEGADPALLQDAGKRLPLVKEVIYSLEKENVPSWNKFLQGYYDASGVSSDSFDQAVAVTASGGMQLTDEMKQKDIQFLNVIQPTIMYLGFNMADPVVGGYSEKQRKLRQALSIAINYEEYISIFLNGRGVAAQGPIPPGIFGYSEGEEGINPYISEWHNGVLQRKSMVAAKKLLAEAGYPDGRQPDGSALTLYFDTPATGPDSKSMLNWYRKQFEKLGIQLVIRATDYNRFQDKVRGAKAQMFVWGWNADYPDPENFLFLLYGGNAVINTNGSGINSANYDNPEFNRLFERIKTMDNTPERLRLIKEMVQIAQKDAPWVWGFYPKSLALYHGWYHNVWPNPLANNTIKYKRVDFETRLEKQKEWNQPVMWPLLILFLVVFGSIYPLVRAYRSRQGSVVLTNKSTEGEA
ncbi:ABC transporter substrate-binding protein [Thiomicrorhabdus sp. ZW0627]|uniref:ABC transporter substrate-binding protein n=1 Tax=Thiomicrorhabdus sp. ZW0627 TaxID=3039774 RepID=UPI0024369BAB|nr:ABC transporter substrate-binding protein [Thiomicrorhabdus sp. ZW0627]MDG6772892.1 ABC transporter substrate-binding protein [Thiomicrorhabdus sp. ZW0627]